MISQKYINSFKQTKSYESISEGLMHGEVHKVLLGQSPYRITSKYEMDDTIPSQVLICIHILIRDGQLTSDSVNEVIQKIKITHGNICLLLDYLNVYLVYRRDHNELKLDYETLLDRFTNLEKEYHELPCYKSLMDKIKGNLP